MDDIWHIPDIDFDTSDTNIKNAYETMRNCRFLFETTSDPILIVRLIDHVIVQVNDAACELFQCGQHRFEGMPLDDLVADPVGIKKALKRHVALFSDLKCFNKGGQQIQLDISCTYFNARQDKMALIVCRNVGHNQKPEKHKSLYEALALEVTKTESAFFLGEENERQRLARELHGHIGPMLVAMKLELEQLRSRKREKILAKDIDCILEKQTQAIKELRIVTSRLAEGYQFQEDINLAIFTLIDKFAESSGMAIYFKVDTLPSNLSLKFRYHLFRIIEECLTNAVIHANANKISLRLTVNDNMLHMYVLDNGQGMHRPRLIKDKGLWLMNERAALLNGVLQIDSVPERHFQVQLKVPFN